MRLYLHPLLGSASVKVTACQNFSPSVVLRFACEGTLRDCDPNRGGTETALLGGGAERVAANKRS